MAIEQEEDAKDMNLTGKHADLNTLKKEEGGFVAKQILEDERLLSEKSVSGRGSDSHLTWWAIAGDRSPDSLSLALSLSSLFLSLSLSLKVE